MGQSYTFYYIGIIAFIIFMFVNPPICFMVMGLMCIYGALNTFYLLQDLEKFGMDCEANIVGFEKNREGDKIAIIEFVTPEGLEIKGNLYGTFSAYIGPFQYSNNPKLGKILIRYNSKNPEQFIRKGNEGTNYFIMAVLVILGIVLIAACFLQLTGVL